MTVDVKEIKQKYQELEKKTQSAREALAKLKTEEELLTAQLKETLTSYNKEHDTNLQTKEDVEKAIEALEKESKKDTDEFNERYNEFKEKWDA